ncbi:hypothetical protein HDU88_006054 [Geranomyces variabilis]|nr:hypothetical protein HDU88_006054 [Geranomyces variabilis]
MNFLRNLIGSDQPKSHEDLVEISSGTLYRVTPANGKQLVFRDAAAVIRSTTTPFQYQLVITRIYAEDEPENDEDVFDDDEHVYLLDKALRLRRLEGTPSSIEWADAAGQGKGWEFEIDPEVDIDTQTKFEDLAYTCMYERQEGKSHSTASDRELAAFAEQVKAAAHANPIGQKIKNTTRTPVKSQAGSVQGTPTPRSPLSPVTSNQTSGARSSAHSHLPGHLASRPLAAVPVGETIHVANVMLHLYDPSVGQFLPVDQRATAEITEIAEWQFQLVIKSTTDYVWVCQPIEAEMQPTFNAALKSFCWNYIQESTRIPLYTWSVVFQNVDDENEFKGLVTECLYEQSNKEVFRKMKQQEQDYLLRLYDDDPMDVDVREEIAAENDQEQWEEEVESPQDAPGASDAEDSDDETGQQAYNAATTGSKNSQLAVGYKHERSFVVRGDKIGVFKHTEDDRIKFATTINNVRAMDGVTFSPRKVMLHQEDSALLMMKPGDENKLYKMDLEVGKIVEEWKVDDHRQIEEMVPDQKYAQLTQNETLVGIGHNSIFRLDPRLAGNKLVESQSKTYATKADFSCAATTGKGELVVGSTKGEIRLYNKLGINAKTLLPGSGDAIIGIDTTENGKWIVATCRTHLLLINTEIKSQPGTLGFQKSMGQEKPQLKRLQLKPEHVVWLGGSVSFTPARFSTGDSEEQAIITSCGKNVIRWNFRRVKSGHYYDYTIKQYEDTVVADNFKYGEDRAIIVALPSEVEMVTKNRLSTPVKLLKSRSHIVNSPF